MQVPTGIVFRTRFNLASWCLSPNECGSGLTYCTARLAWGSVIKDASHQDTLLLMTLLPILMTISLLLPGLFILKFCRERVGSRVHDVIETMVQPVLVLLFVIFPMGSHKALSQVQRPPPARDPNQPGSIPNADSLARALTRLVRSSSARI